MESRNGVIIGFLLAVVMLAVGVIMFLWKGGGTGTASPAPVPYINQISAYQEAPQAQPQGDYSITVPQPQGADLNATAQAGATQNAQLIQQMIPTIVSPTPIPTIQTYGSFTACINGIFAYESPSFESTVKGELAMGSQYEIAAMNGDFVAVTMDGVAYVWVPIVAYANCP
jgi:hypothetical protein